MKAVFALIVSLIVMTVADDANAQVTQCGGYADVLANLASSYDERIVWVGNSGHTGQLVITAKPDGSTWTAILVRADVACLVFAGTTWAAKPVGEDI